MSGRQKEKGSRFRELHEGEPFLIPNPWDVGSARLLESLGFKALASSSAGLAFSHGGKDGDATLEEVVEHVGAVGRATELPLSADLENGYGPEPEAAARAIERVAAAGAVGGSIEDYDPAGKIYDTGHAAERVAAAAEAARRLDFPFTFTARAENHIRGIPTSTTRSPASRPTRPPARTCSMRQASPAASRSARSARQPACR